MSHHLFIYFLALQVLQIIAEPFIPDSKETETTKRVFTLRFTFKTQTYNKAKKYYLIALDDKTGLETLRREVIMDIAFAGDFGFTV